VTVHGLHIIPRVHSFTKHSCWVASEYFVGCLMGFLIWIHTHAQGDTLTNLSCDASDVHSTAVVFHSKSYLRENGSSYRGNAVALPCRYPFSLCYSRKRTSAALANEKNKSYSFHSNPEMPTGMHLPSNERVISSNRISNR
jgi:hypothetical protein